ncbi:MAG: HAD-IC family P-type ATPase [Elusimicrobiales bacterium]|nr:HAD-IC family P-type ATPase [Elusimicrobiales bacterium]
MKDKKEPFSVADPHLREADELVEELGASDSGLTDKEAAARLKKVGPNTLPREKAPGVVKVFFRQFLSPLIYILLIAGVISVFINEMSDAIFIFVVLLLNAVIGTIQEYSAERSAEALQGMVKTKARVLRDSGERDIDAEKLVPGDVVLLESGRKVPADMRLLSSGDLNVDESLLTGESEAVTKDAGAKVKKGSGLGDRLNMVFGGTLVTRGRARGLVTATGRWTQVGHLAASIRKEKKESKPPLLIRMEKFTFWVAVSMLAAIGILVGVEISQGTPLVQVFLVSVALAVAAIPEGLPIALTVALARGMKRMAKRHVIIRKLVAVEALGSCTYIASDKTGTLTVNKLTVRRVALPGVEKPVEITGEGMEGGEVKLPEEAGEKAKELLDGIALAAVLCNEGTLEEKGGKLRAEGDTVDTALLVMAHKNGLSPRKAREENRELASVPFESERRYAASLNKVDGKTRVFVKGAGESVLGMCSRSTGKGGGKLDKEALNGQAQELAKRGYRMLALASGDSVGESEDALKPEKLKALTFLGFVGMIDPLRPEAADAVSECHDAGVEVAMVTGDHPETAFAIARQLGLAERMDQVVTGPEIKKAEHKGKHELDRIVKKARVFARVEPQQKVTLVKSLKRLGHFVAMTGDGANDAPALSAANVGVAMGKRGTDVAKESAALIITDDNFASIVHGIEEGRVAYANARKAIYLLISTGAAEIVLFALALGSGMPLPLMATQLLWLNLVTNGVQDVALAFEPGEGDEMDYPPRSPKERIFNRLMLGRILMSAAVMGVIAFGVFRYLMAMGWELAAARNYTLLLMVMFENVHALNSRSEHRPAVLHNPLRNLLLMAGIVGAQLLHISTMYVPWLGKILGTSPLPAEHWLMLLGLAVVLLAVNDAEKALRAWLTRAKGERK